MPSGSVSVAKHVRRLVVDRIRRTGSKALSASQALRVDDLGETVRELVRFSVVVLLEHLEIVRGAT